MKITGMLKKMNRTLLEMQAGMLFFGMVCQAVILLFAGEWGFYTASLWFGVAFAFAACIHMYRTLDRALMCGADAPKLVTKGYIFRYVIFAVALVIVALTEVMNPIVFFIGYMSLKVTAYLQPITHKLCNKLFQETDPVPEALPEESVVREESDIPSGE